MEKLSSLQQFHYASHRQALLLIFQGMDAAGKDGAIRHVMSGVNPEGCEVFSFKQPSAEELEHDFLWRTTSRLPSGIQHLFTVCSDCPIPPYSTALFRLIPPYSDSGLE
ncbi:MAG: hypothetical protein ABR987_24225 [Terracidiphilus sp.]|jgi:polyphosphate kinase 2 (PPK2 family)